MSTPTYRDIRTAVREGEYENKLQRPRHKDYMMGLKDPAYKIAIRAYNEETGRLYAKLKQDVFDSHGVANHPRAERCWELAVDHASGYGETVDLFDEFVELIKGMVPEVPVPPRRNTGNRRGASV